MTDLVKDTSCRQSFWQAANILLSKPHVINKRVWGSKILSSHTCQPLSKQIDLPLDCTRLNYEQNIHEYIEIMIKELHLYHSPNSTDATVELILIELLPKRYSDSHAFQLIYQAKDDTGITFFDVTPHHLKQNLCPMFSYRLLLTDDGCITLQTDGDVESKSYQWLKNTVVPQFIKWSKEAICNQKIRTICNDSLTLVSIERYYTKYNDLKIKYGKEMVEIWPECTDPSKFVYEDVAIATYLILLWEDENVNYNLYQKQSFVDLGCGNGLLVYILAKEGYQGVGIDVRKRHIWDIYPDNVKLEEKTIIPSDINLFPNTKWIIGNHSDELSPWIPVIAARSSYNCNFFLLPCCAYNFDGTRYQRHNSSISQYTEYLEYIIQLCSDCGFKTDTDRLKIPSTKRICIVGRGRVYQEKNHIDYCNKIKLLINEETNTMIQNGNKSVDWVSNFKPRESVEKVKNCTQLNKNVIDSIVKIITSYLLEDCLSATEWSVGKTMELNEVVQLIPQLQLKALKSECGGLQTLLKNNHHIFKVQSGKVELRYPKTIDEVMNNDKNKDPKKNVSTKIQQKKCWFYNNHPKGCPLSDTNCSFLHVKVDNK